MYTCCLLTCEVAEAVVVRWVTAVWPLGSSGAEPLFLARVLAREGCQTGRYPRDRPWLWHNCRCAFFCMGCLLLLLLPYLPYHSNPQQEPEIIPKCSMNSCRFKCNRMPFNAVGERLTLCEIRHWTFSRWFPLTFGSTFCNTKYIWSIKMFCKVVKLWKVGKL